jgi:tryptophan synthase alpha chain
MTNRYQQCFSRLKQNSEGAFVPFVMLGDPDLETGYRIITTLIDNGADALELGIPFSDPIADGPVIQASAIRALANGATLDKCFKLIAAIRKDYPQIPIGLLVYANLVVANSIDQFYAKAQNAGVDSVLVADVPIIESERFVNPAKVHQIQPIFIATPNASTERLQQVAQQSQGYTYLLSRAGVTGTEVQAEMPMDRILKSLRSFNAPPCLLGFGISTPQQVAMAIASGADGVISGSAVVKLIESNLPDQNQMMQALANFVSKMKQATI